MENFKQYVAEKTEMKFTGTSGFYCSMLLSDESKKRIAELCDQHSLPFTEQDELHCTVMYSPDHIPHSIPIPRNMPIKGRIIGLALFGDNDHLVALVESAQLKSFNRRLVKNGAVSTYPEYRPHITLAKVPSDNSIDINVKFKRIDVEFVSITVEDIDPK